MQDYVWSLDDNQPRFRHEKWRAVFDDQISSNPFSITMSAEPLFALPLAENVEKWEVWLPRDKIWDRLNTLSQISVLEPEEKEVSAFGFSAMLLRCQATDNMNREGARSSKMPLMQQRSRPMKRVRSQYTVPHILLGRPRFPQHRKQKVDV